MKIICWDGEWILCIYFSFRPPLAINGACYCQQTCSLIHALIYLFYELILVLVLITLFEKYHYFEMSISQETSNRESGQN